MSRHEHTPPNEGMAKAGASGRDVLAEPLTRMLLDEQLRLSRQRNLTLVFLEDLIGAAADTLPADPALDTLAQNALRQQLVRSQGWAAHLYQRDLVATRRGSDAPLSAGLPSWDSPNPALPPAISPPAETGP